MTSNIRGIEPVEVKDGNFEEFVTKNRAAVVDCWAVWCYPCLVLSPLVEQLASEYEEIAFGSLNVDENPATTIRYGIMSIPTLLYFKGGKLVDRTIGALPRKAIESRLGKLLT